MTENLDTENVSEEINILLIVENSLETNKSIILNAMQNYLRFSTFDEALANVGRITTEGLSQTESTFETEHFSPELEIRHETHLLRFYVTITDKFGEFQPSDISKMNTNFAAFLFIVDCNKENFKETVIDLLEANKVYSKKAMLCLSISNELSEFKNALLNQLSDVPDVANLEGNKLFIVNLNPYQAFVAFNQNLKAIPICKNSWNDAATHCKQMLNCIVSTAMPVMLPDQPISEETATKAPDTVLLPEINVLLLGESGAGKSTTINALANYLKYGTFKNALDCLESFTEVIPTSFVLPNLDTGETIMIKSGTYTQTVENKDPNDNAFGESETKMPGGYVFKYLQYILRIIDTPGIGDTDGSEQDNINMELILDYLQFYQNLHAVIFIVKGNNSRKTVFFKQCVVHLLTRLHSSLKQNIIFCFTHSRNSAYGIGNGYRTLKSLFENELKQIDIKLAPKVNSFFIDNEAYRFLLAKKCGYKHWESQTDDFAISWNRSAEQIKLMIERIIQLSPHELPQTISFNNARAIILELIEPLMVILISISKKIESIEQKLTISNQSRKNKNELKQLVADIVIYDSELIDLEPCVVCMNCKNKSNYIPCHKNCNCAKDIIPNKLGQWTLGLCSEMKKSICTKCGCNSSEHIFKTTAFKTAKRMIQYKAVNEQTSEDTTNFGSDKQNKTRDVANELLNQLKYEFNFILDVCSKFTYILSKNSNSQHKKYFEEFLDSYVENEADNSKILLQNIKINLINNLKELNSSSKKDQLGIDNVQELKNSLLNLSYNGKTFEKFFMNNQITNEKQLKYCDIIVTI